MSATSQKYVLEHFPLAKAVKRRDIDGDVFYAVLPWPNEIESWCSAVYIGHGRTPDRAWTQARKAMSDAQ